MRGSSLTPIRVNGIIPGNVQSHLAFPSAFELDKAIASAFATFLRKDTEQTDNECRCRRGYIYLRHQTLRQRSRSAVEPRQPSEFANELECADAQRILAIENLDGSSGREMVHCHHDSRA
jgi:hypothetical protein